jgi:hypothetical protein
MWESLEETDDFWQEELKTSGGKAPENWVEDPLVWGRLGRRKSSKKSQRLLACERKSYSLHTRGDSSLRYQMQENRWYISQQWASYYICSLLQMGLNCGKTGNNIHIHCEGREQIENKGMKWKKVKFQHQCQVPQALVEVTTSQESKQQ